MFRASASASSAMSAGLAVDSSSSPRQLVEAMTPVIQPRLLPYALLSGSEFDDIDSYQSKALDRLARQTSVASFTDAKLVQYYSLYCILEATYGKANVLTGADYRFDNFTESTFPKWTSADGWLEVDRDPCGTNNTWHGITCDEQGRVTEIALVDNLLSGFFPPEVKLLAGDGPYSTSGAGALNLLDLFDNPFLFNNFDNSWMTDLGSNMEFLFVGSTGFAGRFPEIPVGVLEADFSYTLIQQGFDDSAFAYSPLLEYLNLGGNTLNVTMPSALASLPNLQFLYVHDCLLQGDLSYLQQMPSIYEHWVDANPDLKGTIPDWIGQKTSLASLSMTDNGLTGTIPSSMGGLTNLQQLWLYDNKLTGPIPTELGNLALLKTLEVEGNQFTGSMPAEVCDNTGWFGKLNLVGADCQDEGFDCACCTCCSLLECQPALYPYTESPTPVPVFTLDFSKSMITTPTP